MYRVDLKKLYIFQHVVSLELFKIKKMIRVVVPRVSGDKDKVAVFM